LSAGVDGSAIGIGLVKSSKLSFGIRGPNRKEKVKGKTLMGKKGSDQEPKVAN